jgi:zinc protease
MKRSLLRATVLATLCSGGLALGQAPQKVTSVEGITEYRLGNGLTVLLFPDPTKPTITVNVTYKVGARNENYGETGMAHLLEHLMFKGSPKHPNVPQELTSHGARPNGTTSFDRTNYFETFSATDENLQWALELEADRMVNSFIAKKDLDSEMTVVRNEFESGENNPQNVVIKRILAAAFDEHNYRHTAIGARSDIENVPIERLQAFWRNYYQPDNAVLLVAGKIDEGKTLALVNRIFGPIPRPTRALQKLYTSEPTQDGERSNAPGTFSSWRRRTTYRQARTRMRRRCSCLLSFWAIHPPGACTRRWSKPRKPPRSSGSSFSSPIPAFSSSAPRSARRCPSRTRRRRSWTRWMRSEALL